jgi:hypothetical protein
MRLSKDQIESAVTKYQEGLSIAAVGALYGVSGTAIGGLLKRRGVELRTLSEAARKLPCNHSYFREPLDEERAYWIGFILADGAVNDKSYGVAEYVAVALAGKDIGHIEKLKTSLQSGHKITPITKPDGHTGARLAISSPEMVSDLRRYGVVPNKSADHNFSDLIPVDLLRHYFRGYFDGNGSISRNTASLWTITMVASERFLSKFAEWLNQQLGGHTPEIKFYDGIHRIAWSGTHRCKEILDLLYAGATISLDRKQTLYDKICIAASTSNRGPYNRK